MSKKPRAVITERAKSDVRSIRAYIARDKPKAAARWVREFQRHVRRLAAMPLAFELIPEADKVGAPFRHIIFGNYRIFYYVTEQEVAVLAVVHGARVVTRSMLGLNRVDQ